MNSTQMTIISKVRNSTFSEAMTQKFIATINTRGKTGPPLIFEIRKTNAREHQFSALDHTAG